jgi:lactoylglutathione lyase
VIRLGYIILYVRDVEQSVTFYETAFDLTRKFVTPENDYGELLTGDTTLAFAAIDLAASNLTDGFLQSRLEQKPFGQEVGFVTDEVSAYVEKSIIAGAALVASPITKPWGQVVAYVRDIDGFLIEICSPIG